MGFPDIVRYLTLLGVREAGANPARSRHCDGYESRKTSHCQPEVDGKARQVDLGLSQETCLENFNRPLRKREKGFMYFLHPLKAAEQ
jgi:hypothetical protein